MLRLAEKAFWPARIPFPVMHVDTGHNFAEVLDFRDRRVAELGVQARRGLGAGVDRQGPGASRRPGPAPAATGCRPSTLLDAIVEHQFDAVFGGGRRDEEKARAKERVYSFRDEFGQWDPKNQRPELWRLYNGRHRKGEHMRVFPISNWTELDVWQYIERRGHRDPVDLLRPPARGLPPRRHVAGGQPVHHGDGRRGGRRDDGALPHRRRRQLHRRRRVRGGRRSKT